jgi:LysM repeat protein
MKHASKLSIAAAATLLALTGCAGAAEHGTAASTDAAGARATLETTATATPSPSTQQTTSPTASAAPSTAAAPTTPAAPPTAAAAPAPAKSPARAAAPAVPPTAPAPAAPRETGTVISTAYTTGYGFWDNTPAGSPTISHPIIHKTAGGAGTWADPATIAVGHSLLGGTDRLDYAPGTRLYIPNLQKYFIVEDTCGDGATPQDGPCHTGAPAGTTVWFDVWIGGSTSSQAASDACNSTVTDTNGAAHTVIVNPSVQTYKVTPGDVLSGGACRANYGNTPVTQ